MNRVRFSHGVTNEQLLTEDWPASVTRLGGAGAIGKSARETRAFLRGRGIRSPILLLRLLLAYCLGEKGLRLTAVRAASMGLAGVSNVALPHRLRRSGIGFRSL